MEYRYDYQFHIWSVWDSSNWLMVQDSEKESGYFIEPFLYLLFRLQYIFDDVPIDTGECRYKFKKDPNHFVYQWDDLFGIAVEYRCSTETAKTRLQNLLNQVNEMGNESALAPEDGPDGIDRFSSNGIGLVTSPNTPEQEEAIDIINREMAEKEQRRRNRNDGITRKHERKLS